MDVSLCRALVEGREREIVTHGGRVAAPATAPRGPRLDLAGRTLLPGLVNGHDHLALASFPALGRPPYANVYAWTDDVRAGLRDARAGAALAVAPGDRLVLGALRNLLAGVTAVVHHDAWHATLAQRGPGAWWLRLGRLRRHGVWLRAGFPVRVLRRYAHAHSPGLEPDLARTLPRSPRTPWMVHAAEGRDARAAGEIAALGRAGLLRRNSVLVHALGATPADVVAVARAGAAVVWCPASNRHLYGAGAPIAALRAAGVRLALGSDSPLSGVRDALSNLAVAREANVYGDAELVRLATSATADVFGLATGGFDAGDPADYVAIDDVTRLLRGDRRAVQLVIVGGCPLYGVPELMNAVPLATRELRVDGEARRLEAGLATLLARLLAKHPALAEVEWLRDVRCA